MPVPPLQILLLHQPDLHVAVSDSPQPSVASSGYQTPVLVIDHVVPAFPAVFGEAVVEDVLDYEAAGPGFAGPVFAVEALTDCAACAVAADDVVCFHAFSPFRLGFVAYLEIDPGFRFGFILPYPEALVIEPDLDEITVLLHTVPVHHLNDLAQGQNSHAILVVGNNAHVDLD